MMNDNIFQSIDGVGSDNLIYYSCVFDEYGLPVMDGGSSYICIGYCPWCGAELPESKRELFFKTMEKIGIDPFEEEIPTKYEKHGWRNKKTGEM